MLTLSLFGGKTYPLSQNCLTLWIDSYKPSESEFLVKVQKLKAILMILRRNPGRYSDLQDSVFNRMSKERKKNPKTIVDTYDLLQCISNNIYNNNQRKLHRGKRIFTQKQ